MGADRRLERCLRKDEAKTDKADEATRPFRVWSVLARKGRSKMIY